jgi:hypothetical protein
MSKAPETPNEGGSYVREDSGKLTLKARTGAEPVTTKPTAKKKGDK